MIWDQKISVMVQTTGFTEKGVQKCEMYLPQSPGQKIDFGEGYSLVYVHWLRLPLSGLCLPWHKRTAGVAPFVRWRGRRLLPCVWSFTPHSPPQPGARQDGAHRLAFLSAA